MSDSDKPKCWFIRRQSIKHKWFVPFIFCIEWPCEWISYWLKKRAFLDVLARLGHLAIVVAVIFYIKGCPERQRQAENQRKAKQYQAWQVINIAQGKPGGGGRKDALEDLHKDRVLLVGVDISKAFLPGLNLHRADLMGANLSGAYLSGANFSGAILSDANLSGAILYDANFCDADLSGANLSGVDISRAIFSCADFICTNLSGAHLSQVSPWFHRANSVDFSGTGFFQTNFSGADLSHADFSFTIIQSESEFYDANLSDVNFYQADLSGARFSEVDLSRANLFSANISSADLSGADLSDANLIGVHAHSADLSRANLSGADLSDASLWGADLRETNLSNIRNWQKISDMSFANIFGVDNTTHPPPEGFIGWAIEHGAVSIENREEWEKFIREKRQEQTKKK